MRQTSFFECLFFDLSPFLDDGLVTAEVDVGGRQVAEAFVIAAVVVALDEGADGSLYRALSKQNRLLCSMVGLKFSAY